MTDHIPAPAVTPGDPSMYSVEWIAAEFDRYKQARLTLASNCRTVAERKAAIAMRDEFEAAITGHIGTLLDHIAALEGGTNGDIDAAIKALHDATGGELSAEDHTILDGLIVGQEACRVLAAHSASREQAPCVWQLTKDGAHADSDEHREWFGAEVVRAWKACPYCARPFKLIPAPPVAADGDQK